MAALSPQQRIPFLMNVITNRDMHDLDVRISAAEELWPFTWGDDTDAHQDLMLQHGAAERFVEVLRKEPRAL